MTAAQLLTEYAPPPLFHGRHWGEWTLDVERLCLVYDGKPVDRGDGSGITHGVGRYLAYIGRYEVDLETIKQSSGLLDWIFQVGGKSWAGARVMRDFLNAVDSILHPQKYLCSGGLSGGGSRTISNPGAFLRARFASVGKGETA